MKNSVGSKTNNISTNSKSRNSAMTPGRSRLERRAREEAKCSSSVKESLMKNRTVYKKSSCAILLSVQLVLLLVIINYFMDAVDAEGATRGRHNKAMQFRDSPKMFGGYRITPKFCQPSRPSRRDMTDTEERRGPALCMFNHECSQRQGEVVGTCMDGFLFGACCQLFGTPTLKKDTVDSGVVMMANDPNLRYPEKMTPDKMHLVANEEIMISVPQIMNTLNENVHKTTEKNMEATVKDAVSTLKYTDDPTRDPDDELNEQIIEISNHFIKNPSTLSVSMDILTPSTEKYIDLTSSGVAQIASSLLQTGPSDSDIITVGANPDPGLFSHSTISHEEADTILVDNKGSEIADISRPSDFSAPDENIQVSTMQTKPSMETQYSTKYDSSTPANRYTHKPVYQQDGTVNDTATIDLHGSGDSLEEKQSTVDINVSTPTKYHTRISTTTQVNRYPERPPYKKPGFRPKPTKEPSKDKFVLVQTVTRPQHPLKTSVTSADANQQMASIESIIGMLNGSFASDYDSQTPSMKDDSDNLVTTSAKPHYSSGYPAYFEHQDSTTFKYPTGGHFITTTVTKQTSTYKPPSTSYVYNPTITRRPSYGASSTISNKYGSTSGFFTRKPTVHDSTTKYQNTEDNNVNNFVSSTLSYDEYWGSPSTSANRKPPSTSYVYSPTPTKRPESNVHHVVGPSYDISNGNLDTFSSVTPTVIVLSGFGEYDSQTPNPIKYPIRQPVESEDSPDDSYESVQIKPQNNKKPVHQLTINNIITSNNMINLGQPVKYQPERVTTSEKPSPTVLITPKPSILASSTTANNSKPGKPQITIDEEQEKPVTSNNPPTGLFLSSTLARRPTTVPTPLTNVHSSPTGGIFAVPTSSPIYVQTTDKNEVQTSPDELINFPPVRNPNLNATGSNPSVFNNANVTVTSDPVLQEVEFTTPAFLLQEDDELNDKMSLFVNKIVGSFQGTFQELHDIVILDKTPNTTITQQNVQKPNETATKKPSAPTKKPNSAVTKKPTVTTKKPVRTATTVTTKKPKVTKKPAKVTTTTPPSTKNPLTTIVTQAATTRKPTRLSTTTKKPKPTKAKTPATTTVATTLAAVTTTEVAVSEEEAPFTTETPNGEYKHLCGVRPMVKSGRIVGGKGATFGEWPWQVLVRESTWLGLFTKNKCGGVLITNKYVTTAAHCQPGFLASLVAVLGEFDISGDLETKRSITKNVRRVIVHRNYDAATFENDLALLELDSPVSYDTHIVPICMPPDEADFTGRFATVTGWGRLKYGGGVPSVLQEVQVPVIENSVCQEMFQTAGHSKIILNSFLCAGYANGQKDSCEGDSGGPLVLQRPDGRWQLAGTVSHGIKCAAPYLPGVYMRTTYYKPWLRSITGVH